MTAYVPLSDARIAELTEKAKAVGARIHVLRCVPIKQDCEWQQAVSLGAPNTPNYYNIWKPEVSSQYRPVSDGMVERDIVLLNYPINDDGYWSNILAWGKEVALKRTNPREVFAVGKQHPVLHREIDQVPMCVVALTEHVLRNGRYVCFVSWDDLGREAYTNLISELRHPYVWSAFSE